LPGSIDVSLDLTQSDGATSERAIRVENGVVRVFPALMDQAIKRLLVILYEAIAISVSVMVDPEEGGFDVGPEGFHKGSVTGPFIVRSSQ
jgi:hypothetical protein